MEFGTIAAIIGGTIAAFFGAKTLGKVDDRKEDRKRGTMKLAMWARENGLPLLEQMLEDYTVNAKTELVGSIRRVIDVLRDGEQSKVALDTFLKVQLTKALATDEGTKRVITLIEEIKGVAIDREALATVVTSIGQIEE
jgi:translation initiation factor 2B subunit (eIF-2B alpha/beta/delta family)